MTKDVTYYAILLNSLDKTNDVYTLCDALQEIMRENTCSLEDAYNIAKDEILNN